MARHASIPTSPTATYFTSRRQHLFVIQQNTGLAHPVRKQTSTIYSTMNCGAASPEKLFLPLPYENWQTLRPPYLHYNADNMRTTAPKQKRAGSPALKGSTKVHDGVAHHSRLDFELFGSSESSAIFGPLRATCYGKHRLTLGNSPPASSSDKKPTSLPRTCPAAAARHEINSIETLVVQERVSACQAANKSLRIDTNSAQGARTGHNTIKALKHS